MEVLFAFETFLASKKFFSGFELKAFDEMQGLLVFPLISCKIGGVP